MIEEKTDAFRVSSIMQKEIIPNIQSNETLRASDSIEDYSEFYEISLLMLKNP